MAFNKDTIEKWGIYKVDDEFNDPDGYVKPCLTEQDKGEAWDGVFKYYREGKHDIEHFETECKVQVKGRTVNEKDLQKNAIKYQVDKKQLKVYQRNGGVLYFVVYISRDNPSQRKSYYCMLLPFDIKGLLDKKKDKDSVAITLYAVPNSNGKRRYIVESFIAHSRKQITSYEDKTPSLEELAQEMDKWNLEVFTSLDHLFDEPQYLYRTHKEVSGYHQPVMKIKLESVSADIKGIDVALDDKVYYSNCKQTIDKDGVIRIEFGRCLEFGINGTEATVHYKPKGMIDEILRDAEFIKAMLSAHIFRCGEYKSELKDMKYDGINDTIEYAKKIRKLFRKMHVNKEIDLTENNSVLCDNLMIAYEGIVERKTVRCHISDDRYIRSLNIYGAQLPVVFIQAEDGKMWVKDLFDISQGKYYIRWNIPEYRDMKTTVYVLLRKENFMGIGKKNCEILIRCIREIPYNSLHNDRLVTMLLEMIKAYDETKDEDLWKAIKSVATYLLENEDDDVNMINYYLVCAKKKKLSKKDVKKISERMRMIENNREKNKYYMGFCILLNRKAEFEDRYETLTEDEKKDFRELPIMKLVGIKGKQIGSILP